MCDIVLVIYAKALGHQKVCLSSSMVYLVSLMSKRNKTDQMHNGHTVAACVCPPLDVTLYEVFSVLLVYVCVCVCACVFVFVCVYVCGCVSVRESVYVVLI